MAARRQVNFSENNKKDKFQPAFHKTLVPKLNSVFSQHEVIKSFAINPLTDQIVIAT